MTLMQEYEHPCGCDCRECKPQYFHPDTLFTLTEGERETVAESPAKRALHFIALVVLGAIVVGVVLSLLATGAKAQVLAPEAGEVEPAHFHTTQQLLYPAKASPQQPLAVPPKPTPQAAPPPAPLEAEPTPEPAPKARPSIGQARRTTKVTTETEEYGGIINNAPSVNIIGDNNGVPSVPSAGLRARGLALAAPRPSGYIASARLRAVPLAQAEQVELSRPGYLRRAAYSLFPGHRLLATPRAAVADTLVVPVQPMVAATPQSLSLPVVQAPTKQCIVSPQFNGLFGVNR